MRVISKKTNSRLLKGEEYKVLSIFNDGTGRYNEGSIKLVDIPASFRVNNFTTVDGKELPKVKFDNYVSSFVKYEELSVNDILICKVDTYKCLIKDSYYRIESLDRVTNKFGGYVNYVKFEGVSRKLVFDPFRMDKLPTEIAREMALNQVLYDEEFNVVKVDFKTQRKIDFIPNKEKFLMELLSKSILDPNRHNIDIIDWALVQSKKKIDLTREDFDCVLNINLIDILKLIEE